MFYGMDDWVPTEAESKSGSSTAPLGQQYFKAQSPQNSSASQAVNKEWTSEQIQTMAVLISVGAIPGSLIGVLISGGKGALIGAAIGGVVGFLVGPTIANRMMASVMPVF